MKLIESTLLDAVTAVTTGTAVKANRERGWSFVIVATSVTTGATVGIEGKINGQWAKIHEEVITADGSYLIQNGDGHYAEIRGTIGTGDYTDGTYTVVAGGTRGI
jgi:hypothetical protein